jgi:RND family efflux transporter MFP subunit
MSMKKYLVVTLAFALSTGAAGCKSKSKEGKPLPPAAGSGAAPLPEIPDVKPTTGAGDGSGSGSGAGAEAAVSGTLEAREEVAVAPKASGTLIVLKVDEGSKVKKGDLLFQLDSRDAQLMKKQATNQLEGAKLQLRTAEREYDRLKGLVAQNAMPQQQLDTLEAQVDGAKLQISGAQNAIAMANKNILDSAVRSPLSGVVIKKLLSVGEYATMMPPSPVVVIQDQSSLELKFRRSEASLSSVKPGDPVTVTIPSLGETRAATVAKISPMVDPRTRTIELTAVLDNCDGGLRPGLGAQVVLAAPPADAVKPECGAPAKTRTKAAAKTRPTAPAKAAPATTGGAP